MEVRAQLENLGEHSSVHSMMDGHGSPISLIGLLGHTTRAERGEQLITTEGGWSPLIQEYHKGQVGSFPYDYLSFSYGLPPLEWSQIFLLRCHVSGPMRGHVAKTYTWPPDVIESSPADSQQETGVLSPIAANNGICQQPHEPGGAP